MATKTRRTTNYNLISTTAATSNVASEIDARKIENTTQGLGSTRRTCKDRSSLLGTTVNLIQPILLIPWGHI